MAGSLKTYVFLLRKFRNGFSLIQNLRHGGWLSCGPPAERLVLWDGRQIVHPPQRGGLVPVMLGMWYHNDYRIGEFYKPKPTDVVIDVGAHVGLFTLRILQEEPRCRVIALEPSPENFACLQRNIARCSRGRRVELHHLGIGAGFGKARMSALPTNRSFDARTEAAAETDIAAIGVVPLSHLFDLAAVDRIALLKMDVEGAEYAAFSTASPNVLSRIDSLVMEYHDNLVPGTLALIEERLAATHEVYVLPDAGEMHGRLFAVLKPAAARAQPVTCAADCATVAA